MTFPTIDLLRKSLEDGEVFYVELTERDGLVLKGAYNTRKKYLVILGYNREIDSVCGVLLNSSNHAYISRYTEAYNHKIDFTQYHQFLKKETYADCTQLVKISLSRLEGCFVGRLTDSDTTAILKLIWNNPFLHDTDLINFNIRSADY